MCDCEEDLVPAQELKGDVFTITCCRQLGLSGQTSKMLKLFWNCKIFYFRGLRSSQCQRPVLCSSHCFVWKLSLPKRSNADMFSERFSRFCSRFILLLFFTHTKKIIIVLLRWEETRLYVDCDRVQCQTTVNIFIHCQGNLCGKKYDYVNQWVLSLLCWYYLIMFQLIKNTKITCGFSFQLSVK